MFQAHGTFYELPLSGSGGFRRIRPITTHDKHISDFASWRGLFADRGDCRPVPATNNHVYRSDDGQAALWFGNVDDLWRMGAPRGVGGPWKNSAVTNGVASDPYLMFGYERKVLELVALERRAGDVHRGGGFRCRQHLERIRALHGSRRADADARFSRRLQRALGSA